MAGQQKSAATAASNINMVITISSLALTLSGWAALSAAEAESVTPNIQNPSERIVLEPDWRPPLLPTLVPAPAQERVASPDPALPTAADPLPQRVAPRQRPVAQPAPITSTRSSR